MGATDGHAKNFSIAIKPGGRFTMTPLYDVLSAEPSFANGEIPRNQYRLAMSVGSNKHYIVNEIMPRHFIQTAKKAGMGQGEVTVLFNEIYETGKAALEKTIRNLPENFPKEIIDPIARGFLKRLKITKQLD